MSMEALLFAVRDRLRFKLEYAPEQCEIMADGRPVPGCGEKFIAVWPGYQRDNGSNGQSLDQLFGVNVTVTVRMMRVAPDKIGPLILAQANTGAYAETRRIQAVLHMDPDTYAVVHAANAIIGPNFNGFIEPLQWQETRYEGVKGAQWFRSRKEKQAGLALTLVFGRANRVEKIENMQGPGAGFFAGNDLRFSGSESEFAGAT